MPTSASDAARKDRQSAVSTGNRVRLLPGSDEAFEALLADINGAQRRVWAELYIFIPDAAGLKVLEALERAARRGCDVVLLIDRFGAKALKDRHVEGLRRAGGVAYWFNPLFAFKPNSAKVTPFGMHRDHRKIVVVDEAVALAGGRNVGADWGGPGHAAFFDISVRIEGPAARDFAEVFLETLNDTTDVERELFEAAPGEGDARVRVLQLDLREKEGALDHAICELVADAREQILFCTPYFIPPAPILDELEKAAQRGVDVRLLTARKSDVPWVTWAGRHLYGRLLDAGVQIWEHEGGGILHAKYYVADRRRTIIGSYNADRWGQRFNQEVAAEVESAALAGEVATCFRDGATRAVTRADVEAWPWPVRLFYAVLYALSHLVAPDASRVRRDPDEGEPDQRALPASDGTDGSARSATTGRWSDGARLGPGGRSATVENASTRTSGPTRT